ncbi:MULTISPECIES: ArnT family glycosyltransferase [unclassified Candidatus Frackibacter]|uniref:ArnT family glycosyltransferase n=1 Tax=unclassified Candidatus Frackibacter TaxID=2648818 RepID=UPI00088CFF00|nr:MULTISPECIES: glycosyltransferase family 39 protein [unclassified Candidatus Frackibacter]SDC08421.1 4-amino-4-deoxy-L-arabinose transferase [Candidatus Frackibacter sp. WG11]SEM38316.1 4-amino-4-deoxy-L-arabinose transferase [Candidatus Frackibacter sp. WG12]SFL43899.1 4-amino-4-deoxy-L-arabinose transferase [Candidatus Frackibacter sp. WG13]
MQSSLLLSKRSIIYILILVLACGILYLPSTVNRDLHGKEELKYVEVAREMAAGGTWLVPHFGGEFYADKPPVYFWILNLSKLIFGTYSTLAMALPSILASIIIVLLTFWLGCKLLNEKYAFLAGLILMTSLLFFGLSIIVRMDLLMEIFIMATLISFYFGYSSYKGSRAKKKYYFLLYLFMGLATTIKGPAGFLVPLVVIPTFLLVEKNLAELKEMELKKGLGLFLGVVLLWIVPALISGGKDYAYQLLVVQTFGRALNSFAHARPFYYYLMTYPVTFLPWTFFLISSFIYLIKNRGTLRWEVKFLLVWFWLPFILFSLISGKLVIYLLPIYPAAVLLVAHLFKEIISGKASKKFIVVPALLTLVMLGGGGLALPQSVSGITLSSGLRPAIISFLVIGLIGLIILLKKRYYLVPCMIVLMLGIFILNFSITTVPALSQDYTMKPLAIKLKEFKTQKKVTNLVAYRYNEVDALAVYTNVFVKEINNQQAMIDYFHQKDKVLAVIQQDQWPKLKKRLPSGISRIYSSNGYLLIYYQTESDSN